LSSRRAYRELLYPLGQLIEHIQMPVEVKDIKAFLEIARRKNAKHAIVKKSTSRKPGSASKTKFKIRCSTYLYTLTVLDQEKAEKLRQSLPPTLNVKDVDAKKTKKTKSS